MAIITKEGQIIFCNEQFEKMLSERLNTRSLPNSIYKLTTHEDSSAKLKQLITELTKTQNVGAMSQTIGEKVKKIEVRLTKVAKSSGNKPFKKEDEEKKNETDKNVVQSTESQQKNMFESK